MHAHSQDPTCLPVVTDLVQGSVVQSTISAIPGLNFNVLFWFIHFLQQSSFQNLVK